MPLRLLGSGLALGGRRPGIKLGSASLLKSGAFQSYTSSPWSAYTGMWGVYVPLNESMTYTVSERVSPGAFPNRTTFNWNIVPDPDYAGINGYLHIAYGNYDYSPGVITSQQVYAITDLTVAAHFTYSGSSPSGMLCEFWLSNQSVQSAPFTHTHEIGFLPKVSASAVTYVNSLPAVGTGSFVDSNGITWNVRQGTAGTGEPYLLAYRPTYADFQGSFLFKDYLAFLVASGAITGNEWINGLAYGVEPLSGAGSVTVNDLAVSMTAAARVPWTISNLAAVVASSTAVNLAWTAAAGATSHQYRVNGGTWTTTGAANAQSVTGLTASTAYTFEVRGVNGTGNGAQSNTANATTSGSGAADVITNGTFATSASWGGTGFSGKSISGGTANFTASPAFDGITQSVTVTAAKYYELTWTISGRTSGSVFPRLTGGTIRSGTARGANGTYQERLLVNTGNNVFEFLMDVGGTLSVDNISLIGPYNTATVGGA